MKQIAVLMEIILKIHKINGELIIVHNTEKILNNNKSDTFLRSNDTRTDLLKMHSF